MLVLPVVWILSLIGMVIAFSAVLRPIERASRARLGPTQFLLSDLLSLFIMIQAALAMAFSARSRDLRMAMGILAFLLPLVIWWISLQVLSRAGVRNGWHRALFILLVVPGAIAGVLAAFALPLAIVRFALEGDYLLTVLLSILEAAVLAILLGLNRLTRAVVDRAEKGEAEADR